LANLTDDEISDDEIMRTTSRMSPVPTPMETEEQREVEDEDEEEDVPEGGLPVLCSTLNIRLSKHCVRCNKREICSPKTRLSFSSLTQPVVQ